MPAAFTATRISPGPGSGSGRSSIFRTSGPPCSVMTSARTSGTLTENRRQPGAHGRLYGFQVSLEAVVAGHDNHLGMRGGRRAAERVALALHDQCRDFDRVELVLPRL